MEIPAPFALIAELTHSCPLHCVYCSNPVALNSPQNELTTDEWARVFDEASSLGVVQIHLTGGEPLARPDILEIVGRAYKLGLYTNLITSGIGLTRKFALDLAEAGLSSA